MKDLEDANGENLQRKIILTEIWLKHFRTRFTWQDGVTKGGKKRTWEISEFPLTKN